MKLFRISPISRVAILRNRLARAPYFRGHGVHSPYVYSIVREVFMRHTLMEEARTLYEDLVRRGVAEHRAMQIANLGVHCHLDSYAFDGEESSKMQIVLKDMPLQKALQIVMVANKLHQTVVIMEPYASVERWQLCEKIIRQHRSTTVDNRGYLLIFNNHLPKQHFRI